MADQNMNNHLFKEDEELALNLDIKAEICFSRKDHPEGKMVPIPVDGKEEYVLIPLDIKDGDTIKVSGKGKLNPSSGKAGDLYVSVHIEKNRIPWKLIVIPILTVIMAVSILILFLLLRKRSLPSQPTIESTITTSCDHVWIPADCTTPKTCEICGEISGAPLGHQWKEATYDVPKACSVCGKTEGDSIGYPITWCKEIENSNNPNAKHSIDVSVGTWSDVQGVQYPDSIKYWVNASMVDTEFCVYDIGTNYSRLLLSAVNAEDNAVGGENQVVIYADDVVIYQSTWIQDDTLAIEEELDITGVRYVKIECKTRTHKNCYCIVSGLLFK